MQIETIDQAAAAPSRAAFTAETVALEAAAAFLAKRIVERRNTIPILAMVRIEASPAGTVTLTGCDRDIWATVTVPATVESPGAVCIDAATLAAQLAKVRKAGSGFVDIAHTDQGRATLKAGRTRFNAPAMPVDDFPMPPTGELAGTAPLSAFTMPAVRFLADLAALAPCISTEETRYYLNGIALQVRDMAGQDRFTMAATDGHNIAAASRPLPAGAELLPDVILPRKAVAVIDKAAKLAPGAELIAVEFDPAGRGAGMFRLELGPVVIQAKAIDGTFPDWSLPFADMLAPIGETEAPLFPELIPGTPLAAMAKLDKPIGGIQWQNATSGKLGTVPGDDGLIFGAMNLHPDNSEPVKGYRYGYDQNDAAALEYLSGQAVKRHGKIPHDWEARLCSDARGYCGATIGKTEYVAGYWEDRPNWETLAIERIHVESRWDWQEGSYSVVMPRERTARRCDVTLEIDGDSAIYPIAVNSGGKIHLSADQVRNIAGESCFETIALTIAGRAVHIVQWLFDQGDSRFLTVRPDGRCYSGKDAWRAEYLSRETVEAAMRGEELPEPLEIASPEGAESESEPCPVSECGEAVKALSGLEIEPEAISDDSGNIPAAVVMGESHDCDADPFAELAARVAAIEARLAAPLSGESSPAPVEAATPIAEPVKRTAAHERAVRRAWAERKARRERTELWHRARDARNAADDANAELQREAIRARKAADNLESMNEALRGRQAVEMSKRRRSTILARQRGKQMAVMAGMIAAKANAYSEAELAAAVAVERDRAAELQRDLDQARASHAGVADGAGVAAAQAAAQMERAMQAEEGREALRADLDRERAALAAVTERNARLLQGMADLAERVERAEAAIAA